MTDMIIRPFDRRDEADLVALWEACDLVAPQNNPHKDIRRKLKVNPEWFLVGELEGKLIATCMVGYEGHRGWINYLAVGPEYQRRGFARQMMARAEQILHAAGCPKINLQVRSTNIGVIAFYERIGYRQDPVTSLGKRLDPDE